MDDLDMNDFEKHIQQQRPWMDVEAPDLDAAWDAIADALPDSGEKHKRDWFPTVRVAAMVVLIFGAGMIANHLMQDDSGHPMAEQTRKPFIQPEEVDPQFVSEESLLQQTIAGLMDDLNAARDSTVDLSFLDAELREIETMDKDLRASLAQVKDQEKVLKQLLRHYQQKIRILERMLREVKKRKQMNERNQREYV